MTVQHREQHRQTVLLKPHRETPGIGRVRIIHQRLDFHQQRPRAFLRHQHAGPRNLLAMLREKQRRRIVDAFQAFLGHGEHPELIYRAKTVFHRADQAEAGMRVAFEIQHGVHNVLQHARSGQCSLLGHVPDKNNRRAALLGVARELRRAFAHLRHRARRRLQRFGI